MLLFVQFILVLLSVCSWKVFSDMPWNLRSLTVRIWQNAVFTAISALTFILGVYHAYGFMWNVIGLAFTFLWLSLFRIARRKRRVLNQLKGIVDNASVQFPDEGRPGEFGASV